MNFRLLALAATAALSASTAAFAAPVLVVSRAALGGDDFIDWSGFGPNGSSVANPSNILTDDGNLVVVSHPTAANFQRLNQNAGWSGNFAPGDALLRNFTTGALSIDFTGLVAGAGAQIQQNNFGSFTATIEAFDAANASLGLFSLAGVSNSASDNSAIFIGVLDSSATISRIELNLQSGFDFAINQLDITGSGRVVPAPAALALFGLGVAALGVARRR